MRRLALSVALAILSAPALAAPAPAPDQESIFISAMAADPARCNLRVARLVTLEDVARDYAAMVGQCVAVRGYWFGAGLYLRAEDASSPGALHEERFAASRIGLYGLAPLMRAAPRDEPRIATAVGSVSRCEAYHDDPGVTIMGYCHSVAAGAILALAQMHRERPQDRRAALSGCRQSRGALANAREEAWGPVPSARAAHLALRRRAGVPMPNAPAMILFHVEFAHHTRREGSIVAVRGTDGLWRIDQVGEESAAQAQVETRAEPRSERTLSADVGRRLDALLRDRCLYLEPERQTPGAAQVGFSLFTMEIVTPERGRSVTWSGRSLGVTGAIADLVLGREED